MECVICGESTLRKLTIEKSKHIENIKARKQNIEKEIVCKSASDPQLAEKLFNKSKNYDEEVECLERPLINYPDTSRKLCENCELEVIKVIGDMVKEKYDIENNEDFVYEIFLKIYHENIEITRIIIDAVSEVISKRKKINNE